MIEKLDNFQKAISENIIIKVPNKNKNININHENNSVIDKKEIGEENFFKIRDKISEEKSYKKTDFEEEENTYNNFNFQDRKKPIINNLSNEVIVEPGAINFKKRKLKRARIEDE